MENPPILRSRYGMSSIDAQGERKTIDHWLFLGVFLIGVVGIVLFRSLFGISQLLVTGWAIILMLFYWFIVSSVPRFWLRADQAGDNIYYLGFLFTLASLSLALYYFTKDASAVDQIVANFGIALATTILGVTLRVVMHQMRQDPMDTEREARLDLAEASSRLRTELDISVRRLDSFARQVEQSIEEMLTRTKKTTQDVLDASSEKIAQAGEIVVTSTRMSGEGITAAFSEFNDQAKKLTSVSRRQVKATESLVERIEAIEVPADLIQVALSPVIESMKRLVVQIEDNQRFASETLANLAGATDSMLQTFTEMAQQTGSIRGQVEGMSDIVLKVQDAMEPLERVGRALGPTADVMTRFGEVLSNTTSAQETAMREQVEALQQVRSVLYDSLASFNIALDEQVKLAVSQVSEGMNAIFIEYKRSLTDLQQQEKDYSEASLNARKVLEEYQKYAHSRLAGEMEEVLHGMRDTRKKMEQEVKLAQEATTEVLEQLAAMIRTLGEQLGTRPNAHLRHDKGS